MRTRRGRMVSVAGRHAAAPADSVPPEMRCRSCSGRMIRREEEDGRILWVCPRCGHHAARPGDRPEG
jgi:hypothetical protein